MFPKEDQEMIAGAERIAEAELSVEVLSVRQTIAGNFLWFNQIIIFNDLSRAESAIVLPFLY